MFLKGSLGLLALIFMIGDVSAKLKTGAECTQPGLMCQDCDTLVFCRRNDEGEWEKDIADICTHGSRCSSATTPPSCSFGQNDPCDPNINLFTFYCKQPGLFPHPFECKKYFNCIIDDEGLLITKPLQYECKNGMGYNSLTTRCQNVLNNDTCPERLVEPCYAQGRRDAIRDNKYMYSICMKDEDSGEQLYFPQLYYCDGNEQFITGSCGRAEGGLDEDGRCARIGFFYDPDNCKRYNECLLAGLRPTSRSCALGFEFDPFKYVCVSFQCR